ncbi:undecaprenyldiphospho-muramoylpentapeptide beta-N-acetylglucosaminyltransferase [Halodesulfovibrio sp.]|jgi:UDP-N-acetylglucosamine--N-acetylmuramyl-(pentapeptide) pyrophosphoryl-undecaprenol N-acetylglucosamine transferase|uniref:undecaprenyldiphospho-muramoylpentapeptide beta-N-acetylglucosaminyltransferase n=1 Tax=Halodesulfovibrio sp. TaxID=1912772 RepID=UPI0025EB6AF0|nr:undecaprenyldiphospho-muramoylpentapeptide beta-N-acetylglucosaminyltransferase [Halodesulfovibrio sp.]MCT4535519.1 undecaprenyldiphospho-muramoylpentapeptide beta-N-acetylglucosaminyltransferase [Halodesulfovibrio sp.]
MKRVVLTTGGTGGHVFPALAVAEEIRRRFPNVEFLFIGGKYGPERQMVEKAGIRFVGLPVRGVLGRGIKAIGAVVGLGLSTLKSMRIIRNFAPDVVIGFGGYAAVAGCLGGKACGIPVAIHEQNSVPGLTNRLLSKIAQRIFISLPDEHEYFEPDYTVLTGNPVRAAIADIRSASKKYDAAAPSVLICGGSLGAKAVNSAVVDMLPTLKELGCSVHHQTGKADYERIKSAYVAAQMQNCTVEPFVDDMAAAYASADLVICRAGATTIAELTVAGKPALFIPFPHATHNHQVHNARYLETKGAAVVVEEHELVQKDMNALVTELLQSNETLQSMSDAAKKLGRPEAAANVVSCILDLLPKAPLESLVHPYKDEPETNESTD